MTWAHFIIFLVYNLYLLGIEWGAAITGHRNMRKSWPQAYKWLVILCWVTAVMETVDFGFVFAGLPVYAVYNVWAYLETGAIILIQSRELIHGWSKRPMIALLVILTAGAAVNYIWGPWVQVQDVYDPKFQLFTLFIQLIAACVALIDILGDTSDKPLSVQPAFWLAAGVLFSSSIFTVNFIIELFFQGEPKKEFTYVCYSMAANTFMYGGFIGCFLVLKKKDKRAMMATPSSNSSQDSPRPPLSPGS